MTSKKNLRRARAIERLGAEADKIIEGNKYIPPLDIGQRETDPKLQRIEREIQSALNNMRGKNK